MVALDDAWKRATDFLDTLPLERVPHLTLNYSWGHYKGVSGFLVHISMKKTEAERAGAQLEFWSATVKGKDTPSDAINAAIEEVKQFLGAVTAIDPFS